MKRAAKHPAERAAKHPARRAMLEKELVKLIRSIDEEGLLFLIKQSRIIIHNRSVIEEQKKALKTKGDRHKQRAAGPGGNTEGLGSAAFTSASAMDVMIEDAPGGKSFVVVLGSTRKVFSRIELRELVAVARTTGNDATRSERLYAWLEKHRGDVLFDGMIRSRQHPLLIKLARFLRTHYTVKS